MDFPTTYGFGFKNERVKTTSSIGDQWIFPQLVDLTSKMQEANQELKFTQALTKLLNY